MDKEEALKIIEGACKLLKNKGQIKVVYNSTKIYYLSFKVKSVSSNYYL
jgi:phosphotransferase system IIB component